MPTPFMKKRSTRAALAAGVLLVLGMLLIPLWRQLPSPLSPDKGAGEANRSPSRSAPAPPSKSDRSKAAPRTHRSLEEALALAGGPEAKTLSAEQIEAFVSSRNRGVDSLLSAFRLGGDEAYLKEALERFPDHPQVLLMGLSQEQRPEQRLALLEKLKRTDPNNALGNCMSASALLELGRKQEAMEELQKSVGKPVGNFLNESALSDEEAYLASGFSPAQAKMMAVNGLSNPHVLQLRSLADRMREMRGDYQAIEDSQSAETLRGIQVGLARQLQESGSVVDFLVGMAVEKKALEGVDSEEAAARLEELAQQKQGLTGRMEQVANLMKDPAVPEGDWLLYFDRAKLFGEAAANEWMLEKHPQP